MSSLKSFAAKDAVAAAEAASDDCRADNLARIELRARALMARARLWLAIRDLEAVYMGDVAPRRGAS